MEHRFSWRRGDWALEFAGDRDFVEAQIARFAALLEAPAGPVLPAVDSVVPAASADPFPRVSPDFKPRVNVSLADFVGLKQAVAPADLLVVTGYYMEKYLQQATFAPGELQAQLSSLPAWDCQAVDDVLPLVLTQGYMEALRGDRYGLTYKGQTYVREGLT